jgi:hypothetical protein
VSATLEQVRSCVGRRAVRVSDHADEQIADDSLSLPDILAGVGEAVVVEDYPDAARGPSVLALHRLRDGEAVHVVWAFRKGTSEPAVLVTAWIPDPHLWSPDFLTRR